MQSLLPRFEYPLFNQKPTIVLFVGDGTHCFTKKMNRDYEKKQRWFLK